MTDPTGFQQAVALVVLFLIILYFIVVAIPPKRRPFGFGQRRNRRPISDGLAVIELQYKINDCLKGKDMQCMSPNYHPTTKIFSCQFVYGEKHKVVGVYLPEVPRGYEADQFAAQLADQMLKLRKRESHERDRHRKA